MTIDKKLFQISHGAAVVVVFLIFHHVLLETAAQSAASPSASPPPPPSTGQYAFGPKFNPQMAIIMIALVSAFFFMGFFSVYIRQCAVRRIRGNSFQPTLLGSGNRLSRRVARGLPTEVIDTFPTFQYSSVKGLKIGEGSLECAVCLNEFEDDETLRLIPVCSHVFHPDCIDVWLESHTTCPVCRAFLEPKPGEVLSIVIPNSEPETNLNQPDQQLDMIVPRTGNGDDQVNVITPSQSTNGRRVRLTGFRFSRLYPRSHSTGHSLVQPGENCERFTLRLREDVRNQIVNSRLNRAKSCVAFPRARSTRTGFRRGSGSTGKYFNYERFDQEGQPDQWWVNVTPPFISKTSWTRGCNVAGGEKSSSNTPRILLNK